MQPTPIAAFVSLLACGGSAYLLARRMRFAVGTTAGLITMLILWEVIQIVPVQLAATLVMMGWIGRVTIPMVAEFEVLLLAVLAVWHEGLLIFGIVNCGPIKGSLCRLTFGSQLP